MSDKNLYDGSCEVAAKLNLLSGRWKLPILWKLSSGSIRYNELKRQVSGITNIMLTRSLQELEANNLVLRSEYPEKPPRVEYSLTEAGRNLIPAVQELVFWAKKQIELENKTIE